ncbi:PREDICTED: glutamate receptor 1.4-like [Prunus mume]|uniref:Glutamate receptor 1.4-like n=1 Tax=Prunus mume TaxID=102107 RepID=A0ABM1LQN9_PRUMU|nr:PREDICTED: glutamate receptor 1.4-like [Prunus mume]
MEFQGKKQTILCLSFVTLFSLLGLLCAKIDGSPNIVVEEVHVGVILDMGSREGKIILSCISTSLSDFYHLHNNYSTRVILHTRDSKGKALHALSAALNLLDKIKVEAIIGAQTRMEANLLAELGEEAKVPVLSLSGLRTSPFGAPGEYPFFVEITQDETSQVTAISGLIEMFKWRAVILLYENTDYGRDIIPFFINSIEEANVTIVYKSCIAASSADEQIIEELRNLTKLKTTVFVVHVSHFLVPRLFLNAKKLGLLSEGYAWIMTSTSMNFLHSSMDPSKPIQLWNDNTAAVYFAQGNKRSNGMRHLHLKFLSAKDKIRDGETALSHIGTDFMIADPLNKGLPNHVFHRHVASMGLQFSFDA